MFVNNILDDVEIFIDRIIGLLFAVATLVFLWGIVVFIASAGDEKERSRGKYLMTWGIIGLAVMAVAWGLAGILVNYLGPVAEPEVIPYPTFGN